MKSLNKKAYTILAFNILIIAFLSAIFINKSHISYPWHSVGMFVFNACLVAAVIISSYHVGKTLFNTKSNQILSLGFFFTSVGFVLLSVSIVGYYSIIREFSTPSFLINFVVFTTVFLVVPMFAARPSKSLLKLLKKKNTGLIKDKPIQNEIESLRESYKPEKIKILFVGESAPASGAFFYDGSPHTFTTNIRKTFEMALDVTFEDNKEFLNYFKDKQCYLDDLCLEPVDHFSPAEKNVTRAESIKPLSERLRDMNPDVIIISMKSIEHYVHDAIVLSDVTSKVVVTPFPGMGHLLQFREIVIPILKEYIKNPEK
jgi:hypothetical protein